MAAPLFFAPLRVALVDQRTGLMAREWYLFFQALWLRTGGAVGPSADDIMQSLPEGLPAIEVQAQLEATTQDTAQATALQAFEFGLLDSLGQDPVPESSQPVGAAPTVKVGLTSAPGQAFTYLRSDATLALDQAIAPTWTGEHKFRGTIGRAPSGSTEIRLGTIVAGAYPWAIWDVASGIANQKIWEVYALNDGTRFGVQTLDDGVTTNKNAWSAVRAGNAITNIEHGNAVDNPDHSFLGNKAPRHGGGQLIQGTAGFTNNAAAAAATILNAPVAGNPTKWIPINDNGVIRNIPAW